MPRRYITGNKGMTNLLRPNRTDGVKEMERFNPGRLLPVMPAASYAVAGVSKAVEMFGVRGINLLMDEADAFFSHWVDFTKIRTLLDLDGLLALKKTNQLEIELYKLIGIPQMENGRLVGPALGDGEHVRSIVWVSATQLPTIVTHIMWGLPIKVGGGDMRRVGCAGV